MGVYSIKDLEQLSGIKAHTIRIWEQRYGLIKPRRTETNIRYYNDDQLKYLLNVALLSRHGYKISHISSWTPQQLNDHIQQLYQVSDEHDTDQYLDLGANDLVTTMIDLDSVRFKYIYNQAIVRYGFESTITRLIYPFLEKVGLMWSIDQITPAHEHFISSLIRQKIIAAIDQLEETGDPNAKKFLLFLPEGEYHEIGLLIGHYLLQKRGVKVYYFGQSLPESDLKDAISAVQPDAALTFLIDPAMINNATATIGAIQRCCGKITLLVAIRPTSGLEGFEMKGVHLLHQIDDLFRYL